MEWFIVGTVGLLMLYPLARRVSRTLQPNDSGTGSGSGGCGGGCCGGSPCSTSRVTTRSTHRLNTVFAFIVAVPTVGATVAPSSANAADTVETFDVGATDRELYMGMDGIGNRRAESGVFGETVLGYGIVDGFSAYVGTALEANGNFAEGGAGLAFGAFGTAIDTDHFDLDLILDMGAGGEGFGEFSLAPSVEINFDASPEMSTWGVYVRAGVPVYGQTIHDQTREGQQDQQTVYSLELNPGAYLTIAEGHQILVEYEMAVHPKAPQDDHMTEIGGIAVGYNLAFGDSIELISQFYTDIPQAGEQSSFGVMTGFVATLPSPDA